MTTVNETTGLEDKRKAVEVIFNKKAIHLPKGHLSGREIKQKAIEQGVPIQSTYVLFLLKNRNHRTLIGDADEIEIHQNLEFAAVADDDNS